MKTNRLNMLFCCSLFIGALQLAASLWAVNQWIVNNHRADTAFGALKDLDRLQFRMRNVRQAERHYLASGRQEFLADYNDAKDHVRNILLLLIKSSPQDPFWENRIKSIERLVGERLREYDLAIEIRKDTGNIKSEAPRNDTEKISYKINSIKMELLEFQKQASTNQYRGMTIVRYLIVANSIIMFCLVSMIFILLRKDLANRISEEMRLSRQRDELEAQVIERTQELIDANDRLQVEAFERIRTQNLLVETNNRLTNILEAMTDGFVALDNEWRYTYINGAAAQNLNRPASALLGKVCWEEFPDSKQSAAYGYIVRAKEENHFVSFEVAVESPPPVHWYENRCYPSPDGMTIYFTDITELKSLEQVRHDLSEYEEKIQEQERIALSREVHDEIGQNLTALKLDLYWIERRLPPDRGDLTDRLIDMRNNLGQLINIARDITSRLRPPLLDNLGLAAALEWQINDFKRRSGLTCQFALNEEIEVDDEYVSTSLLRILKESLSNVLRHAKATEVSIFLYQKGEMIVLEVADNGQGITHEKINSNTSFGVMGMRERAHLCGGNLSVTGRPGEGTKVCCTIPMMPRKVDA